MRRRAGLALVLALSSAALVASEQWVPAEAVVVKQPATRLLIDKSDRTVTILFDTEEPIVLHHARFGAGYADGPKRQQGDERTPEGDYHISQVRTSGGFQYLPALLIDYPSAEDRARAEAMGVDPGGFILIHGPPEFMAGAQPPGDWTDGCIALTPAQLRLVMAASWEGLPVRIVP